MSAYLAVSPYHKGISRFAVRNHLGAVTIAAEVRKAVFDGYTLEVEDCSPHLEEWKTPPHVQ